MEIKNKIGIIPARLHSTRFPKKILADINGKPMVIRTAERVSKCKNLDRLIIAIDDDETYQILKDFDYELMMTSTSHKSGTDRIAEVVKRINDVDVIINIQADEPFINSRLIDNLVEVYDNSEIEMSTLVSTQLSIKDLSDENIVKAYLDENLFATDFNRVISNHSLDSLLTPLTTRLGGVYKHLGIYGFSKKSLLDFVSYKQTSNEQHRNLEQMRAIDNGIKIKAVITDKDCISINVITDISQVNKKV